MTEQTTDIARTLASIETRLARLTIAAETLARVHTEALDAFAAWVQATNEANDRIREPTITEALRDWIEGGEMGPPPRGLVEVTTISDRNRKFITPTAHEIQYAATDGADNG